MNVESIGDNWDVIVIGAGPAGTAAAISCARASLRVLLVDAKQFPRSKVCGGCLNQVSQSLLLELMGSDHPLWQSTIPYDQFALYHRRRKFEFSMPTGHAVDRMVMDSSLVEVAKKMGVTFVAPATGELSTIEDGARVVLLRQNGSVAPVRCKATIVACGLGNLRIDGFAKPQLGGLQQVAKKTSRIGMEAILDDYPAEFVAGKLHMGVGRAGYIGLTRIGRDRLHVAAALNVGPLRTLGPAKLMQTILQESGAPPLRAEDTVKWRGTPRLTSRARQFAAERVFLVGDAASYVEPFTGEGIRWALETGIAVARVASAAKHNWKPALAQDWDTWYRNIIGREQKLCRQISAVLKRPALRLMAHHVLRVHPRFASSIITRLNSKAVHDSSGPRRWNSEPYPSNAAGGRAPDVP